MRLGNRKRLLLGLSAGALLVALLAWRSGPASLLLLPWFLGLGLISFEMAARLRTVSEFSEWAPPVFFWLFLVAGLTLFTVAFFNGSVS
ncbi:MAG: hypothetical protein ABL883_13240 [Terricaulis sp.]